MSVRSVAVVGRDAPFWLTVLALDGALKGAGISLRAIALPSAVQDGEAIAAAPSLSGLHRRLGLDDRQLLQAASGVRAGGQHLRGWGPSPFLLGFEDPVRIGEGVDVGQYWAVERLAGAAVSRDRLSPCAVAMANGRVAGDGGQRQFPIAAGFHLDAAAYASALEAEARRRGIDLRRTDDCRVEASDDGIGAVVLADGERVTADLFVDVSGSEALLASALPGDDWDSWSDRIPTRSIRWTSAPPLMPRPPFSDLTRTAGGWEARVPLADRTALLSATGDGGRFDAGQRTAWRGNLVAIGYAACRPEPVDHLALHMTHVGIANLIAWFPGGDERRPERERYNETVALAGRHLLDFQACRHDAERARAGSAVLEQRLNLFDAIGTVPAFDEDPFDPSHWERYFAGLGRQPASASVAALALPTERRHAMLGALVADIDREVAALPTVLQDLAR